MYTRSGNVIAFDSIRAVEGKFFVDPSSDEIEATIKMTFVNRASGTTFGKAKIQSPLFSKETVEAFRAFLQSAEKDFGSVVFQDGASTGPVGSSGLGEAESTEPPKPKALGGV